MKKKEMLLHWNAIEQGQPLQPAPVPYKHTGSTYDEDGLRITGSREWIDSVLSRIGDLLKFENGSTRLQVVYKESTDRKTKQPLDSFNCYIQVHERGREGQIMHSILDGCKERAGKELNYIERL